MVLLLTSCAKKENLGIDLRSNAIPCEILIPELPTWSEEDSKQSLKEAAYFLATIDAFCPING